jgi:NADH dehydrogenase
MTPNSKTRKIIIAGSGFAGVWAAFSAARAVSLAGRENEVEITVVSPTPHLHIRPRLYEALLDGMAPEVGPQLAAVGARHLAGRIERIDTGKRQVDVLGNGGRHETLDYDRFILATGSQLFTPDVPGLREHAFNVDQLEHAETLNRHLQALAAAPDSAARNTVVVAGGGFTGIETVAEMPQRLREILGKDADIRVVIVDPAPGIGWELGEAPRPVIEQALVECGVEMLPGNRVVAIDAEGVTTSTGQRIASHTVIWTAGMRANPLAAQIAGDHDRFGRLHTDSYLRAKDAPGIFVAGDVALAATDNLGNFAAMSCQHALSLGRVAGHNAAAELVGLAPHPYRQPKYVTCLDIGTWGALFTEGWDRQVRYTGAEGKAIKREINTKWIYPPQAERDAIFAVANPDFVIVP